MKVHAANLQDALAIRLDDLLDAEDQLRHAIPRCLSKVASPSLHRELSAYAESCDTKMQKIQRVYNYVMREPKQVRNNVIERLIANTQDTLKSPLSDEMRDVLMISCLQTINHYKLAAYKSVLTFAGQLELTTAADQLQEIIQWESQTEHNLAAIALHEVNPKTY